MQVVRALLLLLLAVVRQATASNDDDTDDDAPPPPATIVVYVEGLSQSMLDHNAVADYKLFSDVGFATLKQNGLSAQYLLPEFPTLSAPNFFSMFTGLYPAHHGIYGDVLYDVQREQGIRLERFDQTYAQAPTSWNSTQFIWQLALEQGVPTSMYYWRYCPKAHKLLYRCTEHISPSGLELSHVIANVIEDISSRGIRLIMIDIDTVAVNARQFGLTHPTTVRSLQHVSNMLYELQNALAEFNAASRTNVVVLSDHGLIESAHDKYTFIDDYLDMALVHRIVFEASFAWIYPAQNKSHQVVQALQDLGTRFPHCELIWTDDELPERWRLPRPAPHGQTGMAPLLLLCQPPYAVSCRMPCKEYPSLPAVVTNEHFPRALAGYDNALPQMKAVFMARGPDVLSEFATESGSDDSHVVPYLRAVDMFGVLCRLLHLRCDRAGHNGDPTRIGRVVAAASAAAPVYSLLAGALLAHMWTRRRRDVMGDL